MANPQHLRILRQGVAFWNDWRRTDSETPDLTCAPLAGAKLKEADLAQADLEHANLNGAELVRADLGRAHLAYASLAAADLSEAKLCGAQGYRAHLSRAVLGGADLEGARLWSAVLTEANLTGATLTGAELLHADLTKADLTGADLRGAYWQKAIARDTLFDHARLLNFRTADCDFTGAKCSRADFSDYDDEPKWRNFAEGEFEKLYGPMFGVEVLFDPDVDIALIGEVLKLLRGHWEQAHPERRLSFDELTFRADAWSAVLRTDREAIDEVRDSFQRTLEDCIKALALPEDERASALIPLGADAAIGRLVRTCAATLGPRVELTSVRGDQRERIIITNEYYEGPAMKLDKLADEIHDSTINVADVINADTIGSKEAGTSIIRLLAEADDEPGLQRRFEGLEHLFQGLPEEEQDEVREQIAAAASQTTLNEDLKRFITGFAAQAGAGAVLMALAKALGA
jgi:uncharacterized protein YjbI with pentapeptide repeats